MIAADGGRFPVTPYPGLKPTIISAREAARHYGMEYGSDEEAEAELARRFDEARATGSSPRPPS
jgi:hypothetical protein